MKIYQYYKQTWHRNLLEKLLQENSPLIKGEILDIGSKNRRYDHFFSGTITAIDLNPNPQNNILSGNIEKGLNFNSSTFNSIICLEVFEYLENWENALQEIFYLLKLEGYTIISIPFFYHDHGDNIRFTERFISTKLEKFSEVKIIRIGNGWTAIWDIIRKKLTENRHPFAKKVIFLSLLPFLLLIKLLHLDKIKDNYYSGLFIILKK